MSLPIISNILALESLPIVLLSAIFFRRTELFFTLTGEKY